ncbi:MAG: DUF2442 domain-containing protein [Candidatus Accumulibacter meliphilus]|uniref:DUF2442 domain-containing protein n=1 Tax=Candidatus Accumulibacter meliphilus TaxID=2211374 RepID=UPI002FC30BC6
MPGTNTLAVEVTHVSKNGFWLLLGDEELLLPFSEFPWFRQATIQQLTTVEWPSQDHLYWPLLDVDLSVESIRHPESFPLLSASWTKPLRGGNGGAVVVLKSRCHLAPHPRDVHDECEVTARWKTYPLSQRRILTRTTSSTRST